MMNRLVLAAAAALVVLATPSQVDAYGAVHRGYTHVGPHGVYHTGRTVVAGPRGVTAYGRTTEAGYHGGYHADYGYHSGYGYGGYGYRPAYAGPAWGYNAGLGSNYRTNAAAAAANGAYR